MEKKFWNQKILSWEKKRYFSKALGGAGLKHRMMFARQLFKGRNFDNILELGCGSGLFYNLVKNDINNYIGVDISDVAINEFKEKKVLKEGSLFCSSLKEIENQELLKHTDLVISLGLLDWLNAEEFVALNSIHKGKQFIHSFSQKKSLLRLFHYLFTFVTYGRKRDSYMAKYYSNAEILQKLNLAPNEVQFIKVTSLVYFVTNIKLRSELGRV